MNHNDQLMEEDPTERVFHKINFLTIKRSVKTIQELDTATLEDFVKKYSIIVIYLLSVIDRELSAGLLEKFSNHSILYLIEEELRTIIIREFAEISDDMETLGDLSTFIDLIDKHDRSKFAHECSLRALRQLASTRSRRRKDHFHYLDTLPDHRRESILKYIISRNAHTALGVLACSHDDIMLELMDFVAFHRSRDLRYIPSSLFEIRFKKNYKLYLNEKVAGQLPLEALGRLHTLNGVYDEHETTFMEISNIRKSDMSPKDKQQKTLNLVFSLLNEVEPDIKEMLLTELLRRGAITDSDESILRSMSD